MANEYYVALLAVPLAQKRWPEHSVSFTLDGKPLCGFVRDNAVGRVVIDLGEKQ